MTFKDLHIIEPILRAVEEEGYTHPTPIQEQSIPILLKGRDLLGCAQTGTGKTASFAIPILQHIYLGKQQNKGARTVKALIVTPTRELAIQIADSFTSYGKHTGIKNTVIFGGVKQGQQTNALRAGVDVLVATPGRLLDLIQQGFITLKHIEYFVLDEADHMLDMGFIHDIKKVIAQLPQRRQSLFFSATMPKSILELSGKILGNPEKVTIKPQQATAERVDQALYFVTKPSKTKLLIYLIEEKKAKSTLVFSRTKHGADKIVKNLIKSGIKAAAIHGNKAQNARQRALNAFKDGDLAVLVATDIAARGIDVDDLSLVINFDLPNVPETYVHRIGRTGRAKASGIALSFCDAVEKADLKEIEKLIKQKVPVISDHPFAHEGVEQAPMEKKAPQQQRSRHSNSQKNRVGGSRNHTSGGKKKSWKGRR